MIPSPLCGGKLCVEDRSPAGQTDKENANRSATAYRELVTLQQFGRSHSVCFGPQQGVVDHDEKISQ